MSISFWLDQSTNSQTKTYDFIIVGGGIAGLSTAYWLQKEDPNAKIAIIEKDRIGFGASGRNAGFVTCGSTAHFMKLNQQFGTAKATEIWKFSEQNRELLKQHVIEDQADLVDYRQTGSCTVAPNEEMWQKYRDTAAIMKAHGLAIQEVDSNYMESDYGVVGFLGGIEYKGDGFVHPVKLLERLKAKLKVDIYEATEVFAIENHGKVQRLKTDRGVFESPKVLLTLNAYLPMVLKNFKNLITPNRGQILVTEPLPQFVKGPCYLTKYLCYFRQLPSGHLLIGGFRNLSIETENNLLDQTTEVIQEALIKFVRETFKHGKSAKVAYQWSGIMGFTPDEQMIIGTLPENPGVSLMAGCSGHGMGLSFHAAKVLAGNLFGREIPEHLNLKRFHKEIT
ncbi:MAG: FAD-binding oxidoreductase [Bdellovibrionales bacterium]|nr:FAD-binding oxidoreductase [Bdellovibrionales bacterium]